MANPARVALQNCQFHYYVRTDKVREEAMGHEHMIQVTDVFLRVSETGQPKELIVSLVNGQEIVIPWHFASGEMAGWLLRESCRVVPDKTVRAVLEEE